MIFRAQRYDFNREVHLAIFDASSDGKRIFVAEEHIPVLKLSEDGTGNAWLKLKPETAQSLMDALYSIGFRPSEAKPQDATIESIKYHLEDMRKLVFDKSVYISGLDKSTG